MVVLNEIHFRLLESFLNHVKASGGETESDGILAIDGELISSLSHGMEGPVSSAISILRTLKDLYMTLNALREAVGNGLSMAQKKLLPVTRHHGILSLPHEIIAQIIRQVYDDDAYCATESIPLINHYFRNVAIRTPELWTQLTTYMDPRLFMERSRPLGLEVMLVEDPFCICFIDLVAPEAERWTSLSIPSHYNDDNEYFKRTRDALTGKTFSALRELHIQGHTEYYGDLVDSSPLYGGWNMPSLRTIESNNTLPSIQLASLTCLHLSVGDSCSFDIDLDEIAIFLQTVPLLTELSLDIGWFKKVAFRTWTEPSLPNVKTLRLTVMPYEAASSSLTHFLEYLDMPNLFDLSVAVIAYRASRMIDWINAIFPKGRDTELWPSLESLDLSMSCELRDMSAPYDLMERIPDARHLSIRAVDVAPPLSTYWNVQLPHLRTLCFQDCNKFNTEVILAIPEIFRAPEFETLTIHNCKKIDTEVVRGIMPGRKALVSTTVRTDDISLL